VGLDVKDFRDRYPSQLSGGERQRVGVARALAADPPLMLMDEPFGAVDPIVRERLQNELLRLQEQIAKTIVFVTHDIDEAIKMGDLVAVLRVGGVLAQFAPPAELLANPASDFVARFVGADRGLKRLSLRRVGDLDVQEVATVQVGQSTEAARDVLQRSSFRYVLLVDKNRRPIGWLDEKALHAGGPLTPEMARSQSPVLTPRTTQRDALSQMLSASVLAGVVVDDAGGVLGVVTVDQIAATLREQVAA
jgi:osmoprotectant transport system ATP-binding protein